MNAYSLVCLVVSFKTIYHMPKVDRCRMYLWKVPDIFYMVVTHTVIMCHKHLSHYHCTLSWLCFTSNFVVFNDFFFLDFSTQTKYLKKLYFFIMENNNIYTTNAWIRFWNLLFQTHNKSNGLKTTKPEFSIKPNHISIT